MTASSSTPAESPLFYQSPVPLDREKHRGLKTDLTKANYNFARETHVIPALIDEFSPASRELPIVFLPGAGLPTAVFLVGLKPNSNQLVGADGAWTTRYVPAYLRRYPFILGESAGNDPVLCIDEQSAVLSTTDGEPLFTETGEMTPALTQALNFTNEYFAASKRTEAFIRLLQEMDLFHAITIEARADDGVETQTIHGLLAVNEAKLYELSDADFLKLRDERILAPIFAHFFSLTQIERVRQG